MRPTDYYHHWVEMLESHRSVVHVEHVLNEIDELQFQVKARVTMRSGYMVHLSEYLVIADTAELRKYRYHVLDADGRMVARWDNAAHHPHISTHPRHTHRADGQIENSFVRNAFDVLEALADR